MKEPKDRVVMTGFVGTAEEVAEMQRAAAAKAANDEPQQVTNQNPSKEGK